MAISSNVQKVIPYVKRSGNYEKLVLPASSIVMSNGKDLETELNNSSGGDSGSPSGLRLPNYERIISTYNSLSYNSSFTVYQDCWAKIEMQSGWTNATVSVNNNSSVVQQIQNTNNYPVKTTTWIPLKANDYVTMSATTDTNTIKITLYELR